MTEAFDNNAAEKKLKHLENHKQELRENLRKEVLAKLKDALEKEFQGTHVEVYLVGSIIKPYCFNKNSDVDIVLKNFSGDRFDIWTKLEGIIERNVEIILYETCHFQNHVIENGLKIL